MDRNKVETYLKYGFVGVAVIAGGLLATTIIKGVVALGVLIVGGGILVYGTPVLAQKLAHLKTKGLLHNAAKDPIPELLIHRERQHKQIQEAIEKVKVLGTETRQYGAQLETFRRTDPEHVGTFEQTHASMVKVYNFQVDRIKKAQEQLKDFDAVIDTSRRIWAMTQASIKASKALRGFQVPDPMEEIRKKTAIDSVQRSMHQAIEEMQTSMTLDYHDIDAVNKAPAISNDPSQVIDANFTVQENARV